MRTIEEYQQAVRAAMDDLTAKNAALPHGPAGDRQRKALARLTQQQLRLVKRDLSATMRAIRAHYQGEKAKVGKTGGAFVGAMVFGQRSMGKLNTLNRDHLRRQQIAALAPYERMSMHIDYLIAELSRAIAEADAAALLTPAAPMSRGAAYVSAEPATVPPPPPATVPTVPPTGDGPPPPPPASLPPVDTLN